MAWAWAWWTLGLGPLAGPLRLLVLLCGGGRHPRQGLRELKKGGRHSNADGGPSDSEKCITIARYICIVKPLVPDWGK